MINNCVIIESEQINPSSLTFLQTHGVEVAKTDEIPDTTKFVLRWQQGKVMLSSPVYTDFKPFAVEFAPFVDGKHLKHNALVKAVGYQVGESKSVLDATAGWGQDAFVLASVGFEVTMLEIHPVIVVMLQDALARLADIQPDVAARMHLKHENSANRLRNATEMQDFQVIYLDPMYPECAYRAQVKKPAQLLRLLSQIFPEVPDSENLLSLALQTAEDKKVVVKRPRGAQPLSDAKIHHQIRGKTIRFDIY